MVALLSVTDQIPLHFGLGRDGDGPRSFNQVCAFFAKMAAPLAGVKRDTHTMTGDFAQIGARSEAVYQAGRVA